MKSKIWIVAALLGAICLLGALRNTSDHFGCHRHGAAMFHCH